MKTSTSALDAELYERNVHRAADLVTFYLAAGTTRWSSFDANVVVGGDTWTAAPIVSSPQSRAALRLEVDSCDLEIAPGDITVGGVALVARALRGDFHGIRVAVSRAWITTAGSVAGVEPVFDGSVVEVEVSSTLIRLAVKSVAHQLSSVEIPSRLIQPGCPYQIGDSSCGVTLASFTSTTTVAAGTTSTVVNLAASTTNANKVGWVEFTSGSLSGVRAAIAEVLSSTSVRLAVPLFAVPTVGDGVKVVKGCTKDRDATTGCDSFDNELRFGGFPSVTQAEAA